MKKIVFWNSLTFLGYACAWWVNQQTFFDIIAQFGVPRKLFFKIIPQNIWTRISPLWVCILTKIIKIGQFCLYVDRHGKKIHDQNSEMDVMTLVFLRSQLHAPVQSYAHFFSKFKLPMSLSYRSFSIFGILENRDFI